MGSARVWPYSAGGRTRRVNLAKIKNTLTEEVAGAMAFITYTHGVNRGKTLLTLHALIPENAHVKRWLPTLSVAERTLQHEHSTIQSNWGRARTISTATCTSEQTQHARNRAVLEPDQYGFMESAVISQFHPHACRVDANSGSVH